MKLKNHKTTKLLVVVTILIFAMQLVFRATQASAAKQVMLAKSSAISSTLTDDKNENDSQDVQITSIKKIPHQTYDQVLTGQKLIFDIPGTISSEHVLTTSSDVRALINQSAHFMAYQKATAINGLVYYKIVSLHHSVRGWINSAGITSVSSLATSKGQLSSTTTNKISSKDNTNLTNFNVLLKSAYDNLNKIKLSKNINKSSQIIIAKNALDGAANTIKQTSNTSMKNKMLTRLNAAIKYMDLCAK